MSDGWSHRINHPLVGEGVDPEFVSGRYPELERRMAALRESGRDLQAAAWVPTVTVRKPARRKRVKEQV